MNNSLLNRMIKLGTAIILGMCVASTVSAAPIWSATGPGAVVVTDADIGDDSQAQFTYLLNPAGFNTRSWEFKTTATSTGQVTLDFHWTGFHAFFQVRTRLETIDANGNTTIINDGPVNCCTPPSNGFNYAGQVVLDTVAGQQYGFKLSGSNYDSNNQLRGTFTIELPLVEVAMDIKFCSDPNAFNCKKNGVLPVTIFGTDTFDAANIDTSTLQLCLEDLSDCTNSPRDWSLADRGDPNSDLGAAQCTLIEVDEDVFEEQDYLTQDGFLDLDAAFEASEVQDMLGDFCAGPKNGVSPNLIIIGQTFEGALIFSVPLPNAGVDQLVKKNQ